MAGHSHAANVRRTKEKQDAKKAKLFTRLAREVTVAIGNDSNPETNAKLRTVIAKVKAMGLPKANIERAINTQDKNLIEQDEVVYEAYWKNIAIIINTSTDNRSRTTSEVKNVLSKANGALGEPGSAAFLFQKVGILLLKKQLLNISVNELEELAILECDAEEVNTTDEEIDEVYFTLENFDSGSKKLLNALTKFSKEKDIAFIEDNFLGWIPHSQIVLNEEDSISLKKILDSLEELDDVVNVFSNGNF